MPSEIAKTAVVNAGIGSATIESVEAEISPFAANARCVAICVDVNDAKVELKTAESVKNFKKRYSKACLSLRPKNGTLVLSTIPPVELNHPLGVGYYDSDLILRFNDEIRLLSESLGAELADTAVALSDADGNLKKGYSVDGVHLQPEAYTIWRSVMTETIEVSITAARLPLTGADSGT